MSAANINLDTVMDIIKDVSAEKIEPRFQKLSDGEINTKTGPSDLVTIADIEAEIELDKRLCALLPGSIALGEEAISKGEKSLDSLNDTNGTYWVIDPVDGTHNFAHGKPVFGTMVALISGGQTIKGWIYDIPGKRAVMAEQGAGALLNNQQIKITPHDKPLPEANGYISTRFAPDAIRAEVDAKKDQLGSTDALFCCAHEYVEMIEGNARYAVYTRTKPWDHLPGTLIINEAGGYVRRWNDTEYGPLTQKGGILAASDKNIWNNVYSLFLHKYIEDNSIFS